MTSGLPGGGFTVTKCARRAARIVCVGLPAKDKVLARRRNRRRGKRDLQQRGEDALFTPKLWTGWDVA